VGKDAGRGKLTFPTVEGAAAARARAEGLAAEAVAAAAELGESAGDLGRLAAWIVGRSH
jgi:hypothetical protein